jgi:hypothetical protein
MADEIKIPEKNEPIPGQNIDGYKNTPMQPEPHDKWHIPDPDRPQPPVVEPKYDGKPVPAPKGAIVIFDGKETNELINKTWQIKDGIMTVGKGSQKSKRKFGDMHLHVEFFIPLSCVKGIGQKQGNSGIFLMGKYEIQVLNCWGNRTYADGMTGALYGQMPPLVNACKKPGEWSSYDIHFTAPVFDKDKKVQSPAKVTVYLNNVKVQDNTTYRGASAPKRLPVYKYHLEKESFSIQAHGDPVQYRNIWVAEPSTSSAQSDDKDFKLILNKDLTGWMNSRGTKYDGAKEILNKETKKPAWAVEGNALVWKSKGGSHVWSQERYSDFILDLEVKTKGNSGIFFRTDNPRDPVQTGIELQIVPTGDPRRNNHFASFYNLKAPSKKVSCSFDKWHRLRLTCKDNILSVVVDGEKVNEMDVNKWTEAKKNPDGSKNKCKRPIKDFVRDGHIGFQDHGDEVHYRNIRVKRLK